MKRFSKRFACACLLIAAALWLGNTSVFVTGKHTHDTRVIAHRGVHQIYAGTDRSVTSCQAAPVEPITHAFIENTLPSMQEAFRLGADIVEIDVHLTPDNVFAVFHDWTLDCRTNGSGVTHKHPMDTLAALDVAHNIDDGTGTFALRGQGTGMMPSLTDVFNADMGGQFLINFKSRRAKEGTTLAQRLAAPQFRAQTYGVYGGAAPTRAASRAVPGLRGFDKPQIKDCLVRYFAIGWMGQIPKACRDTAVMVPQNFAVFLWGWPHRFTRRMASAGTDVILVGPYDGSGFSSGIDDADAFARVPPGFDGFVWTNRIELIGPLVSDRD